MGKLSRIKMRKLRLIMFILAAYLKCAVTNGFADEGKYSDL